MYYKVKHIFIDHLQSGYVLTEEGSVYHCTEVWLDVLANNCATLILCLYLQIRKMYGASLSFMIRKHPSIKYWNTPSVTSIVGKCDTYILYKVLALSGGSQYWKEKKNGPVLSNTYVSISDMWSTLLPNILTVSESFQM